MLEKQVPKTIHRICRECGAGFYHNPATNFTCGYCTEEGLNELIQAGKITQAALFFSVHYNLIKIKGVKE